MSAAFAAKTPASEVKPHRQVRLVGEIVRPPWFSDLSDDKIVLYPSVRPEGETVGFVYQVISRSREERYHVAFYDAVQEPTPGTYLLNGRIRCHCPRQASSHYLRKCWHAELTWERKERDRRGEE